MSIVGMATKIMLTREEIFAIQESERNARLQAILDSDAPKKIIVAGAGTGKTYTFERLLKLMPKGNNLVLTFINKLKDDMHSKLGEMSKVQTFHEFSIGRLRSLKYELSIYPKIYTIIESDSDNRISGISEHFQKLDWDEGQLNYCLARMNYYKTHGFDDALYLLLENIRLGKVRFKEYDIILIDEFQDFNALEVALIKELEKHGNIVIVGDDEQALYDFRNASPVFLREFYQRENFEKFSLPFCSRCPDVIVKSLKDVVSVAESNGYLNGHIPREYECFSKDKEVENKRYPHIKHIRLVESWTIPQFIKNQIEKIPKDDIEDSRKVGDPYPTVLILGPKHYLQLIKSKLNESGMAVKYQQSTTSKKVKLCEGYEIIILEEDSNIGWRIVAEACMSRKKVLKLVPLMNNGTRVIDILPKEFVEAHRKAIEVIKDYDFESGCKTELYDKLFPILMKTRSNSICDFCFPELEEEEEEEETEIDIEKPEIILSSVMKSKGLQAGFVFLVGANNGELPIDPKNIKDNEICQFIVALTRAKKECYIVSNTISMVMNTVTNKPFEYNASEFVSWIDAKRIKVLNNRDIWF